MSETPKFAHLQYAVLHTLEITIAEYWYLDMVYQLSRGGWCTKRLDAIAEDMRMTKRGVIKLRDRLVERGLIVKSGANNVRTSEKVNKVYFLSDNQRKSVLSSRKSEQSSPKSEQSTPKNNSRITKITDGLAFDKPAAADYRGQHSPAKERLREMMAKRKLTAKKGA